jgi:pimeloyl-ACP methyl ester carboxylesterase
MNWLGLFLLVLAVLAATYWFAPGLAYGSIMAMARRAAGLRPAEVEVDGHRIRYLAGGSGEPLLLLHGFGANKDHWTLLARQLTRHFRVIAPDLPGFGESSRNPQAHYGLDAQLRRLDGFIAALGLERCHLGGNSMGGYLAAHYAARYPARVASLILLAPAGVASAPPSELQAALATGLNPLLVTDEASFARLSALCFVVAPPLPRRFKSVLVERAIAEAPFNAKIFEELFSAPVALEQAMPGAAMPTLVLWGDSDRVLHPAGLDVLRALLPGADCILMRDMGHVPMVERPSEVAAALQRFRAGAAAGPGRVLNRLPITAD